jgi:hypothetical protein
MTQVIAMDFLLVASAPGALQKKVNAAPVPARATIASRRFICLGFADCITGSMLAT